MTLMEEILGDVTEDNFDKKLLEAIANIPKLRPDIDVFNIEEKQNRKERYKYKDFVVIVNLLEEKKLLTTINQNVHAGGGITKRGGDPELITITSLAGFLMILFVLVVTMGLDVHTTVVGERPDNGPDGFTAMYLLLAALMYGASSASGGGKNKRKSKKKKLRRKKKRTRRRRRR